MLNFIFGAIAGACVGVILMRIFVMSGQQHDEETRDA